MIVLAAVAVVAGAAGCAGDTSRPVGQDRRAEPVEVAEPAQRRALPPGPEPAQRPDVRDHYRRGKVAERLSFDDWVVGAERLPVRDDGFGQIRPTPPQLRVRRLRTPDVLPPPAGGRFSAVPRPVTPAVVRRTSLAWFPGCPVGLEELRLLQLAFWGFDGRPHTGQLVVNASVADDVVTVFGDLYAARFPIEEMRLVTRADLDAPPTGDGNVTAAYACRPVRGSTAWSAHAYGLAVDVNPFMNPYRNDDLVLPELASAYLDRGWRRPGMIFARGPVVRAFERVGWTWGGTFSSVLDLHHFSANGR